MFLLLLIFSHNISKCTLSLLNATFNVIYNAKFTALCYMFFKVIILVDSNQHKHSLTVFPNCNLTLLLFID